LPFFKVKLKLKFYCEDKISTTNFNSTANTKGAEVLYRKIGELCDIDENTVVLDICCGTGTIGLTLARVKLE
jgi:tRNA (uracil-5-)-methyltransferase